MKRGKFSLSNYKLLSMNMGNLIPIGINEVLPGDTIQQSTSALLRCSPLLAPVMHPVHVSIRHFFVPTRIIWDDFEKFITGGPDGMDASVYPTIAGTTVTQGSLHDYLGLPLGAIPAYSALPFRAYQMIYNEYFRDQDLMAATAVSTASGNDTTTTTSLRSVAWEKDYFTSSRPWEQKGPAITLPLGNEAVVKSRAAPGVNSPIFKYNSTNAALVSQDLYTTSTGAPTNSSASAAAYMDPNNSLYADLTGASTITVNVLREAMALQRYEEARARFGSRYTEYLRYLGVRSSDARLQRPEYLGGGKQTIQFSEVLQTAEGTDPVGELRGHGISTMRSNRYRRFFEEHGYIVSLMYVRPKTVYMQGMFRHWNRRTKEDFFQKELQHIGQQEVMNKEVYALHGTPDGTFGFQDRYDEYRRTENTVAGEFRTSTLDHWHFARNFSSAPALNGSFVTCTPSTRPFADTTSDRLYVMAHHSIQARRIVAQTGNSFIF